MTESIEEKNERMHLSKEVQISQLMLMSKKRELDNENIKKNNLEKNLKNIQSENNKIKENIEKKKNEIKQYESKNKEIEKENEEKTIQRNRLFDQLKQCKPIPVKNSQKEVEEEEEVEEEYEYI